MLSFETAVKLQDAGFPQNTEKKYYTVDELGSPAEPQVALKDDDLGMLAISFIVSLPNLSEIIDACGDSFYQLGWTHNPHYTGIEKWFCVGTNPSMKEYYAISAEEAVSLLYLAIHPIEAVV